MRRRRELSRGLNGIGIPVELADATSAVWGSRSAARAWLSDHDLTVTHMCFDAGPCNRHDLALEAWALAYGPTREQPWGNHRQAPDYEALEAVGVVRSRSSVRLDEVFTAAGVKVVA